MSASPEVPDIAASGIAFQLKIVGSLFPEMDRLLVRRVEQSQ
jgi:hypothetical protein